MLAAMVAVLSMRTAHADVITVAQVLPLDGSIAISTRATADAAELYLRRVNDAGGVNGRKSTSSPSMQPAIRKLRSGARRRPSSSIARPPS
uniref:Leucine-binding protein domain-containing protein n=2 Tax=Ralstonia syzygii TaxID=28097 RepID=G3ABD5_9RALS|nr:exported hypothetical protein [Ralstonia syzygii R24]